MTRAEIDALVAEVGDTLLRRIHAGSPFSAEPPDEAAPPSAAERAVDSESWPNGIDLEAAGSPASGVLLRSCQRAIAENRRALHVPASRIALIARGLRGSPVRSVARCGLPWGAAAPVAMLEAELALAQGANEIVLTADVAALVDRNLERAFAAMAGVQRLAARAGAAMTVALPVGALDERACLAAAALSQLAGASSLQLDLAGASTAADQVVRLARRAVRENAPVAVSGAATPLATLRAVGADRLIVSAASLDGGS